MIQEPADARLAPPAGAGPFVPLPPDGSAEAEVSCIRCGYSLIGLDQRRPCPECGLLAGLSYLDGRELRHNRPRWLTLLSLGAALVALAFVTAAAFPIGIAWVLAASRAVVWGFGRAPQVNWILWASGLVLASVPALALALGLWLLTLGAGRDRPDRASRRSRFGLRLLALFPLLVLALAALAGAEVLGPGWLGVLESPMTWFLVIFSTSVFFAWLFIYLKELAVRAPAPLLAADSPVVGIVLAVCLNIPMLLLLMASIAPNSTMFGRGVVAEMMLLFNAVWVAVGITAWLWSIYLLIRYAAAFAGTARQARQIMQEFDASRQSPAEAYHPAP